MAVRKNRKRKVKKNRKPGKSAGTATMSANRSSRSGTDPYPDLKLPDPGSMEAFMSMIERTASSPARREVGASDADRLIQLNRAQDTVYEAWESGSRTERIALAKEALSLSEICADAWVLMAEEAKGIVEERDLYEHAVAAGEIAIRLELGPDAFTENAGYFWRILCTRPYMRALESLSDCMWEMGEKEESIASLREMLRLNPNDNQGIRSFLISRLFAIGDLEGVADILEIYREPDLGEWGWNMALLLFIREGDSSLAVSARDEALETNSFVPEFLTGARQMPASIPSYYSPGSPEEAVIYTFINRSNWSDTKGALRWVAEKRKTKKITSLHTRQT